MLMLILNEQQGEYQLRLSLKAIVERVFINFYDKKLFVVHVTNMRYICEGNTRMVRILPNIDKKYLALQIHIISSPGQKARCEICYILFENHSILFSLEIPR